MALQRFGPRTLRTSFSRASASTGTRPGPTSLVVALAGGISFSSTISQRRTSCVQRNKSLLTSRSFATCGRVILVRALVFVPAFVFMYAHLSRLLFLSEFSLVAGPEEMSDASTTSDRHSPSRSTHARSHSVSGPISHKSASKHARRNSTATTTTSSPPSTPNSHDSDLSDSAPSASQLFHPSQLPAALSPVSPTPQHHHPAIKAEPYYDPPLAPIPELTIPHLVSPPPPMPPAHTLPIRVTGLCLWANPTEPMYIDVDDLPFIALQAPMSAGANRYPQQHSQGPMSPSQQEQRKLVARGGTVKTSLRVRLSVPIPSPHSAPNPLGGPEDLALPQGFSGAVAFSRPLPSSKVVTRVHIDGVRVHQEIGCLTAISSSSDFDAGMGGVGGLQGNQPQEERHVALLPDSWLARCRVLLAERAFAQQQQQHSPQHPHTQLPTSPASPAGTSLPGKTLITQQIFLDNDPVFVVIFDLTSTSRGNGFGSPGERIERMSASLVHWNKHVDPARAASGQSPQNHAQNGAYIPPPEPALVPLPMPIAPLSPSYSHQQQSPPSHPHQQTFNVQNEGQSYGMSVGMGGMGGMARYGMGTGMGMTGTSANDYLYSTANSAGSDPWVSSTSPSNLNGVGCGMSGVGGVGAMNGNGGIGVVGGWAHGGP